MKAMAAGVAVAVLAVATMGTVLATSAEDDLAVVKRAVQEPSARVEPDDGPAARAVAPRRALAAGDLRWFKVRITEKGAKKAKVTVNLPIALVRALGDDFPIDIGGHHGRDGWRGSRRETALRLGDVLSALEAGQSLVEIDDEEATVRVWVE
jgi:hypothetical protein